MTLNFAFSCRFSSEIFDFEIFFSQEYIGNEGDFFVFLNNRAAPKHQLIEIDMTDKKPGRHFDIIVPVSDVLSKQNWNDIKY